MEMNDNDGIRGHWTGPLRGPLSLAALVLTVFLAVQTVNAIKSFNYIGRGENERNLITVTGEGEAFAVPDVAEINFTVSEEADTVPEAQELATEKMNAVLAALEDAGIEENDIKTIGYNVYPKYEYSRTDALCYDAGAYICPPIGRQVIVGYEVSQSVSVKIRDVETAGDILATIGGLEVSNVGGISFTIDDEEAIRDEARDEAIADAQDKAKQLAESLDVKLVRLVSFNESGGPYPYYAKDMALGLGGEAAVRIAPELPVGENKITSTVSLTYEIR